MCGFDTQFCENCGYDHHIVKKDIAIKQFLSQCRQELLDEVVKIGEETLTIDVNKYEWLDNNKKWKDGIEPCIECENESRIRKFLENLTKLKE